MQHRVSLIRHSTRRIAVATMITLLLLVISTPISLAQSGRRPPKRPTSPDPLPPKQEEPPIKPSSGPDESSKIPAKVVWYLSSVASSSVYARTVQEACLEPWSQPGSIRATASYDEKNRKEAVDLAKASSDTYVVWFELEPDMAYNDRGGIGSVPPQYLTVRFEVYTPTTGKTKTS